MPTSNSPTSADFPTRLRSTSLVGLTLLATSLGLGGCSGNLIDTVTNFSLVHEIDVGQGSYLEQDAINQLKPGMTKRQVRFLIGSPNLNDPFHLDRWDYIHRYQHGNGGLYDKRITLFFENDKLSQISGNLRPFPDADIEQRRLARQQSVDVPPQQLDKGLFAEALSTVGLERAD